MKKPSAMFDRDREWADLTDFVEDAQPGATLGVVSVGQASHRSYKQSQRTMRTSSSSG